MSNTDGGRAPTRRRAQAWKLETLPSAAVTPVYAALDGRDAVVFAVMLPPPMAGILLPVPAAMMLTRQYHCAVRLSTIMSVQADNADRSMLITPGRGCRSVRERGWKGCTSELRYLPTRPRCRARS
eukprot:802753-Rhodomonas_salina.3